MSSKLEMLKQQYDKDITTAADTPPAVIVLDENWKGLLELNGKMCNTMLSILEAQSELLTREELQDLLVEVQSDEDTTIAQCMKIYDQIKEYAQKSITEVKDSTKALSSQAGRLNELYSSKMKMLDEYRRKFELRMLKITLISQLILGALFTVLALLIR